MKKKHSVHLHSIARLAVVLGIVALLPTANHFAFAQNAAPTVTVPGIPSQLINQFGRDTRLDNWNSGNMPTLKGSLITTTAPSPTGEPGTPIMSKFSLGINTPRIVSEGDNSAVQIADDAVVHGFLDIHEGILNTDTYAPCNGCPLTQQPVLFHDAVSIKAPIGAGSALSVNGEIVADHILVSGTQGIDSGRISAIARVGQRHTLQGNTLLNGGSTTVDGPLYAGSAGAASILTGPVNFVGGDISISGNVTISGITQLTGITQVGNPLAPAVGQNFRVYGDAALTKNALVQGGLTVSGAAVNGQNGDVILAGNKVVLSNMNSSLIVNGSISSQNATVKIGLPNVAGQPDTQRNLMVNGAITALTSIGNLNDVLGATIDSTVAPYNNQADTTWKTQTASCTGNDKIVSCEADLLYYPGGIATEVPSPNINWYTKQKANGCVLKVQREKAVAPIGTEIRWSATPRARCFSPN